ncbi:MAG TPA: O-antigen ligase family protein [Burkholderiaceae bacterium]|nr:O-antigen ligase family protein [Burkholderiaceae bacterium]
MSSSSEVIQAAPSAGHAALGARVLLLLSAVGSFTSPPLANIAAALGLLAFFFTTAAASRLRAAATRPVGIGVLILLATMALAMFWGDAPWDRRFAEWWSWRPLLLLLVATTLFGSERSKDQFALALIVVLALCAVASFLVLLLPNPVFIDQPGVILRNHTTQGMALVVGVVLAAMLAWGRPVAPPRRLALFAAIALFVANLALVTTGRSSHLALLVAGALSAFSLVKGRWRWWSAIGVFAVATAILASSSMVRDRFATAFEEIGTASTVTTETPIGSRIVIWKTSRDLIARRPWFGYGMGSFASAYSQQIQEEPDVAWRAEVKDPQNQYLRLLVDAGIPGALAFVAFVVGVLRQPAPGPYRGAALALFAAWLATSVFNSHFQTFAEAHLLALVLGVLLAADEPTQPRSSCAATAPATCS